MSVPIKTERHIVIFKVLRAYYSVMYSINIIMMYHKMSSLQGTSKI